MSYEFGPNSTNPRMRRAYARTMIAKMAVGEANYGEALETAWRGSRTKKGTNSGFEGRLQNAADAITVIEQGTSSHRGIRRVPINWEHPKDENGRFIPLYDTRDRSGGKYNIEEMTELVEDGFVKPGERVGDWFMPTFAKVPVEEMGVCLYETTSEGSPITPVFPDTPEGHRDLATYAAEYGTTFANWQVSAQDWEERLFGEQPVSA